MSNDLLYPVVKILIRAARRFYFRKISINNLAALKIKGPLLLACNHPNSFLDAIIVGSLFDQPVHFLARGDAFRKPFARKILTSLKLIPIYRLSEGREYLALNDTTFERCREILVNNGIVLIFAEGLCINQWMLRPVKKGTARIAIDAWKHPAIADRFSVLPVSLNYNSFSRFGKRLVIHFGETIIKTDIPAYLNEGESIHQFNTQLSERLRAGMLQSNNENDMVQMLISNHSVMSGDEGSVIQSLQIKQELAVNQGLQNRIAGLRPPYLLITSSLNLVTNVLCVVVLFLPAVVGILFNAPLYLPIKNLVKNKTHGTVFFDSVMFGLLMILYPVYCIIVNAILIVCSNNYIILIALLMPLFALAAVIWNDCLQRLINYFSINSNDRKKIAQLFN